MPYSGIVYAAAAIFILIVIWSGKRRKPQTLRDYKQLNRYLFYMFLAVSCVAVPFFGYVIDWQVLAFWGFILIAAGYEGFLKKQTKKDIARNFGEDPNHCGRCTYDLTGNLSGTCPECGWSIPGQPHQWERQEQLIWWRSWRFTYLHDWRKSFRNYILWSIAFGGSTVWIIVQLPPVTATVPGFIWISMMINAYRSWDYGQRQRQTQSR